LHPRIGAKATVLPWRAEDSDNARKFFIARFPTPKRIILHGNSYGGIVGAKLIETYAKKDDGSTNFDGALLSSGTVAGVLRTGGKISMSAWSINIIATTYRAPTSRNIRCGPASPPIPI
jgi:hypothetical protein